jgi:regulator of protease activity HflC (stomatin/prohibitin superfamily)
LDDDLAAARAIEAQANADLAAARASGDPRRIRDAAAAALAAKTNREQIEATINNTDALNANTEAMRGFGGSSVFGYRGQDYVLRSLAPPSSDRLVEAAI